MITDHLLVLAQRTLNGAPPAPWHRIKEQWQFNGQGLMTTTPIVILMALLLLVLALLSQRHTRRPRRSAPLKIFRQIISGTGLGKTEQQLLTRIARRQRLPSPLTLVLSQATFDYHVQQYAKRVGRRHMAKLNACAARIRRVVFGVVSSQRTDDPLASHGRPWR